MRKIKLLLSQISNLISLLQETEDIIFDEHPYLLDPTLKHEVKYSDRRIENELKTKETIKIIEQTINNQNIAGISIKKNYRPQELI